MARKSNDTPQAETQMKNDWSFFFEYPVFRQASSPIDSILVFKDEFEELAHGFSEERYSSEKAIKIAKDRFKTIADNAGKLLKKCNLIEGYDEFEKNYLSEKQRVYQDWSVEWTAEQNVKLVKAIYARAYDIVEQYYEAYKDLILRETDGEESLIVPQLKKQAQPLANKLNRKVVFKSRLKTVKSFLIKLVTRMESLDITELDRFYDIHGCSFTVLEKCPEGIDSSYRMSNLLCKNLQDSGGELLQPRYVGPTDDRIRDVYRLFVKDYYKNPKKSKYRAIHISAKIKLASGVDFIVEYHITTGTDEHVANSKAAHSKYKKESRNDIDISRIADFTQIHYDEFEYSVDPETGEETVTDYAGFIECKALTKTKIFRPIGR